MSDDRKDETPAMAIANDVVSIRTTGSWHDFHDIALAHVAAARSAALEEAARVAETGAPSDDWHPASLSGQQGRRIAAAIRELKDK